MNMSLDADTYLNRKKSVHIIKMMNFYRQKDINSANSHNIDKQLLVFLNKNTIIASVGLCTLLSCASVSLPDQANIRGFNLWLDLKKLLPNADVNLLLKQ